MCIDQLTALLTRVASRHIPGSRRVENGQLRVIAPAPGFADLVALVFEPMVHHSRGDLQVLGRVLDALEAIQEATRDPARRDPLVAIVRAVRRQLKQVPPSLRAASARHRARALERSLLRGT